MRRDGYPAYITSAGWLGYPDDEGARDCAARRSPPAGRASRSRSASTSRRDVRRCEVMREEIGAIAMLMADANQVWDVDEAIELDAPSRAVQPALDRGADQPRRRARPRRDPPRRRADRRRDRRALRQPVLFKQLLQAGAIDYCQIDACRLGGLNEVLAVLLLAAKFGVPVCPHAGGLGLCEYVQHISLIDYICVSAIAATIAAPSSPTTCTSTSCIR